MNSKRERYLYNCKFSVTKYYLKQLYAPKQHTKLHHYLKFSHVMLSMTPNHIACKHAPNDILGSMTHNPLDIKRDLHVYNFLIQMYVLQTC